MNFCTRKNCHDQYFGIFLVILDVWGANILAPKVATLVKKNFSFTLQLRDFEAINQSDACKLSISCNSKMNAQKIYVEIP